MIAYLKKSIARQLSAYMGILILLIALGGVLLYVCNDLARDRYEQEMLDLDRKSQIAISIQQNMLGTVTELRGYMAFGLPEFVDKIQAKETAVNQDIDRLSLQHLTAEEQLYLESVQTARDRYFNHMVPVGIRLVKEGNQQELARLSVEENWTEFVDGFRAENIAFIDRLDKISNESWREFNQNLNKLSIIFSVYLVLIALIVAFLAVRLARDIGRPLYELADASARFEDDRLLKMTYDRREDEIGYLTLSLKEMVLQIQSNERRMIEQNEELQAQQEELISQQDELNLTLKKMREKEQILEAQNELNASLVNTLDRDELLKSIVRSVVTIQEADKGAIILLEPGYPHAAVGITPGQMERFVADLDEGILARLQEEQKSFVVTREARDSEKGYHEQTIQLSDLYIPILSAKREIVAIIVLTLLGRRFTQDAQATALALANQVSLSIEKLHTYEESEHERVINQEILDSIREGIQLFDENGHLIQLNQTWSAWMGQCAIGNDRAAETLRLFQLFRERVEAADELIDFAEKALRGEFSENEKLIYQLRGAEEKVIQVYFERIFDLKGILRGTVLVHRDITREYEVDQMKSEFVSTVSHELRTPLSSVLGFTELMLNKELKPERQKKYLTTIHKEAERLTQLINDFLDIQRMESGKQMYDVVSVDLIPLAQELIETFAVNSPKHAITMETTVTCAVVTGDETKLRQVLLNIIGNAVKYSPEGGDVNVRFEQRDGQLTVEITDRGLGIPREALDKLFTKFYRIDNSDRRKIGGTGLGLAICKEIMKAHQGSIEVDSALGEGSTFRLYFPRNQGVNELTSADKLLWNEGDRPRLLIVEDDNSLALLLRDELKESGFQVAHVRDGGAALHEAEQNPPDAIVLDIMLADDVNGWEVIEKLKAAEGTQSIPIFISSALDEKERGLSLGANDYLTKPYQPSKLSNLILQTLLRKEKNGLIMVPEEEEEK